MGEREDLVYQAKLAEQAERYDGKAPSLGRLGVGHVRRWDFFLFFFTVLANLNRAPLCCVAQR